MNTTDTTSAEVLKRLTGDVYRSGSRKNGAHHVLSETQLDFLVMLAAAPGGYLPRGKGCSILQIQGVSRGYYADPSGHMEGLRKVIDGVYISKRGREAAEKHVAQREASKRRTLIAKGIL